jgi:hypothetical protein
MLRCLLRDNVGRLRLLCLSGWVFVWCVNLVLGVDGFWGVVLDWVGFLVLIGYYALGIVVGVLCF